VVAKVAAAAAYKAEHRLSYAIEVDGGIGPETAPAVVQAGAEILVAGNAVYGLEDPQAAVRNLARVAREAQGAGSPAGATHPGPAAAFAPRGPGFRP
jgi:ribulose-phosphate 3-epimerase